MKVERFLESARKMEWSQQKRAAVVWMDVQNKVGWSKQSTAFQEMAEA
jgi:hypothetical protein